MQPPEMSIESDVVEDFFQARRKQAEARVERCILRVQEMFRSMKSAPPFPSQLERSLSLFPRLLLWPPPRFKNAPASTASSSSSAHHHDCCRLLPHHNLSKPVNHQHQARVHKPVNPHPTSSTISSSNSPQTHEPKPELQALIREVSINSSAHSRWKHSIGSDGRNKENKARIQRIIAAGKALANVVRIGKEVIVFKSSKTEKHVSEFASKLTSLEVPTSTVGDGFLNLATSSAHTHKKSTENPLAVSHSREESEEKMAKSKNHTAHNQSHKAHKNGIKKPKRHRHTSTKGMDPKFLRNQRYARKHNKKSGETATEEE
ncbi:unnamed protein product [Fraxinus pennsylvanica]|uniref:60S ribosomal protein L29 n=1 Tax=Fraxinus pennsylvanica TaxID=56036 RepID=A0AAD1ZL67_9LAMI|nr:unnamed protein product [Fraxinus pennsylvanica]